MIYSPGQPCVVFHEDKQGLACCLVLVMEATKLLQGSCEAYLVWVQDTQIATKHRVQASRVVREYMDVFPNELPGIPPPREVDFSIELVPATVSTSVPPYRMALAELRELQI